MFLILCNRSSLSDVLAHQFSRKLHGCDRVDVPFVQGDWGVLQHATNDTLVARTFAFQPDGVRPCPEFSVYNLDNPADVEALQNRPINASPLGLSTDKLQLRLMSLTNVDYLQALVQTEQRRASPRLGNIEIIRERIQTLLDRGTLALVAKTLKIEAPTAFQALQSAGGDGSQINSEESGGSEEGEGSESSRDAPESPAASDAEAAAAAAAADSDGGTAEGQKTDAAGNAAIPREEKPVPTTPKKTATKGGKDKGDSKSKGKGKGGGTRRK